MIQARLAKAEEIPDLLQRIKDSGGVFVDLDRTPCWVAIENDRIIGLLAAELVWQFEPLLMFPEVRNKAVRRRACHEIYRAAEAWITDSSKNITGIYKAFAFMRLASVRKWAVKPQIGWSHHFKRAPIYLKYFCPDKQEQP